MTRSPSTRPTPSVRGPALVALVALGALSLATGCTQETASPPPTDPATTTTTTTTTSPPTTTTTTSTTTTEVTTTTTTTTTTEPEATTTTVSPVVAELVLRQEGIGAVRFGADPDGVVDYLVSFLGAPTDDTGWVASDEFALCPGDEVRRIEWDGLRIGFGDVSPFAADRRHVYSWQYGREGSIDVEPQGLVTESGIGLGSTVADLREAEPDVELFPGEEGVFPPTFAITDDFFGFATGLGDDDVVTEIFSGYFCGE